MCRKRKGWGRHWVESEDGVQRDGAGSEEGVSMEREDWRVGRK